MSESMAPKSLTILNMPHASEWEAHRARPRFLQPFELSLDPCADCIGHCCSAWVSVTSVEAVRIAVTVSLPLDTVVQTAVLEPGQRPPGKTPPIPVAEGLMTLAMRHTPQLKRCAFLHEIGGRGRCSIHGLRPGPCRIFPYEVQFGRQRVAVGSQTLCPVKWLKNEEAEARVRADLELWEKDLKEERRLIALWEKHPGEDRSLRDYFQFVIRRLAPKLGKDPDVLLAPPRRRLGQALW